MNTIQYPPAAEEISRGGWYLQERDRFVASIVLDQLGKLDLQPAEARMLDAGCGTGGVVGYLSRRGCRVVGCDGSNEALEWGTQMGRLHETVVADVSDLPFQDKSFDVVVAAEVLEHLDDHVRGLRELLRVAREQVVITVPAHDYLWTDSDTILLHKRRYGASELLQLIEECGAERKATGSYGLLPGALVLAYKGVRRVSSAAFGGGRPDKQDALPLASRFRIPGPVEFILRLVFRSELTLDRLRLLRWGHGWWCVLGA